MINTLTIDQIIELVKATPEQAVYDWKSDFITPNDDEKRGEFIKDLTAIANACSTSYGFIVYGVDPRKPEQFIGISQSYDDAKLQQLISGKIDPSPEFLYYELFYGAKTIGVLQVKPTKRRPHIITVDLGKVRKGQILIRRGSATDGVTMKDLFEFFYGPTSDHFPMILQNHQAHAQMQTADALYLQQCFEGANQARRDMEIIMGVERGSMGAQW